MKQKNVRQKITGSIVAIIVLAICLSITTFALVYATVSVEENLFRTGRVKINLNDGEPIIRESEFLFEPGMTVQKDFFIENLSTWDVYYKFYFGNIDGDLADVLQITLRDGDTVLCTGRITEMTGEHAVSVVDPLPVLGRKQITIEFHFPEDSDNSTQASSLKFDLFAVAVQTKNNPDRTFE